MQMLIYAADTDDRKSVTGYLFQINGGTIYLEQQKQATVALSN